jgi:hypothetical protein
MVSLDFETKLQSTGCALKKIVDVVWPGFIIAERRECVGSEPTIGIDFYNGLIQNARLYQANRLGHYVGIRDSKFFPEQRAGRTVFEHVSRYLTSKLTCSQVSGVAVADARTATEGGRTNAAHC